MSKLEGLKFGDIINNVRLQSTVTFLEYGEEYYQAWVYDGQSETSYQAGGICAEEWVCIGSIFDKQDALLSACRGMIESLLCVDENAGIMVQSAITVMQAAIRNVEVET